MTLFRNRRDRGTAMTSTMVFLVIAALALMGSFDGLRQLSRRRPLFGYHFEGVRHDAGNKLGFLKATVEFALKRKDLGGPFREYLKSLRF